MIIPRRVDFITLIFSFLIVHTICWWFILLLLLVMETLDSGQRMAGGSCFVQLIYSLANQSKPIESVFDNLCCNISPTSFLNIYCERRRTELYCCWGLVAVYLFMLFLRVSPYPQHSTSFIGVVMLLEGKSPTLAIPQPQRKVSYL